MHHLKNVCGLKIFLSLDQILVGGLFCLSRESFSDLFIDINVSVQLKSPLCHALGIHFYADEPNTRDCQEYFETTILISGKCKKLAIGHYLLVTGTSIYIILDGVYNPVVWACGLEYGGREFESLRLALESGDFVTGKLHQT